MKKTNKIVRALKKKVRRQEEIWKTKKSKESLYIVALTITIIISLNTIIESPIISIDNSQNWSGRQELESEQPQEAQIDNRVDDTLVEGVEAKIAKAFPEDPKLMIAVAKAESGLNPRAIHKNTNGTLDIGIFQINTVHGYDQLSLTDIDTNIKVAREIYNKQGLKAWTVIATGAYKKFLN